MNERNVAALANALSDYKGGLATVADERSIAEFLAGRGVLVPSALLPGVERSTLWPRWPDRCDYGQLVDFLERLAKGEV